MAPGAPSPAVSPPPLGEDSSKGLRDGARASSLPAYVAPPPQASDAITPQPGLITPQPSLRGGSKPPMHRNSSVSQRVGKYREGARDVLVSAKKSLQKMFGRYSTVTAISGTEDYGPESEASSSSRPRSRRQRSQRTPSTEALLSSSSESPRLGSEGCSMESTSELETPCTHYWIDSTTAVPCDLYDSLLLASKTARVKDGQHSLHFLPVCPSPQGEEGRKGSKKGRQHLVNNAVAQGRRREKSKSQRSERSRSKSKDAMKEDKSACSSASSSKGAPQMEAA
eukprot:TRINITY_DN66550_c0_g1_i2.p1 TRINITY_DN66550_c0_g1~~TRINITY_DN66550_c0_g1_i2.p1  ORF type:complete len:282 (-),score=36.65 TRINITY_DN66550_c0_g1_i2:49-894(-)